MFEIYYYKGKTQFNIWKNIHHNTLHKYYVEEEANLQEYWKIFLGLLLQPPSLQAYNTYRKRTLFNYMSGPKNSQKVKNNSKIKSKLNVRIEGNIENESCSST